MEDKVDQTPATNSNPVLSVDKNGCVLYSNEPGNTLLNEWGAKVGEKLPSHIGNIIQRVISLNSPEKMEVKVGNRIYLVVFSPLPEQECVTISGFGTSDQKELEEKLHLLNEDLDAKSRELCEVNEALRKSESKYWHFLENAQEGIWIIDRSDRTIYVNKKISEMLGYNFDEIIGQSPQKFLAPEFLAVADNRLRENRQRINQPMDYRFIRKDRSELWCIVSTHQLFDDEGKYSGSLGMLIDISKRKKAEAQLKNALDNLDKLVKERTAELQTAYDSLKKSEKILTEAQEIANFGSWERDLASNEYSWSDELYRIFGLKPQESKVNYDTFLNYVHPDDRNNVNNAVKETLKRKPLDTNFMIIRANGEERIVHAKAEVIFDEKNNPILIRGITQDITEYKRMEEQIRQRAEELETMMNVMPIAIFIAQDPEGNNITGNRMANEYSEVEDGENISANVVSGRRFFAKGRELTPDELPVQQAASKDIDVCDVEIEYLSPSGEHKVILGSASPLHDAKGQVRGSIGAFIDITKRKQAEEALAKIEIARKQEIHHRIKNNLQVISSLLDLQAEKFNKREDINYLEVLEAFQESQDRVISMALIHEELYKGGGFDALNFSPYIEELTNTLFQTYRLGNTDISLSIDLEENIFFDMDTAVPLGMIVNELVSNSLKHAFSGRDKGEIRIKLQREENGECVIYNDNSSTFILSVSDNGVGIPKDLDIEDLDNLGLQLVTTLVDQLDGELELNRDNGTEFIIRFTVTEKNE